MLVAAVGRRDDAAVAGAAEHADDAVRGVFRTGDAPDDLGLDLAAVGPDQPRQRPARRDRVRRRPPRPGEIAAPRPRPTRRPAGPAGTRPNRCRRARHGAISGSMPPAANLRSGPRTTSPERSIARSSPRRAGQICRAEPEGAGDLAGGQRLRIGAQELRRARRTRAAWGGNRSSRALRRGTIGSLPRDADPATRRRRIAGSASPLSLSGLSFSTPRASAAAAREGALGRFTASPVLAGAVA